VPAPLPGAQRLPEVRDGRELGALVGLVTAPVMSHSSAEP
jgi:hypothetical protein